MKRWIINILCFVSFLLCLCFLFLWIWTQSNELSLQRHFNSRKQDVLREYTFMLVAGRLILDFDSLAHSYNEPSGIYEVVQWSRPTPAPKPYSPWDYSIRPVTGTNLNGFDCLGLRYMRLSYAIDRRTSIFIPLSWLTLFSAVIPSIWLTQRLRRRQRPPNMCSRCGYDLRATPDRCPECGAIAKNLPSGPPGMLPLPRGFSFWKPLLMALSIAVPLMLIVEWLIPPKKRIWFEVYFAFHFIWPTCVCIGVAVAVILRPAGARQKVIIISLIILLLSLLVAAVPTIELYVASDRLANAYTVHDFIFIGTRTNPNASLFENGVQVHGIALAGFGSYAGASYNGYERETILHIWPITLVSAILPASWLSRLIRSRVRSSRAAQLQSA